MMLATEDGAALRGDMVMRIVQRFDLAPVPSTLEATIRVDTSTQNLLVEGGKLRAGTDFDLYRIIKVVHQPPSAAAQNGESMQLRQIIGVLDGMQALMWAQQKAVVKQGVGMVECYRSCGTTARMGTDVPIQRMFVPKGHLATYALAELMAEEFASPVWQDARMHFKRIPDLLAQKAAHALDSDAGQVIESNWLEQFETISAYSCDPRGAVIQAPGATQAHRAAFLPRQPLRVLTNWGRWLAVRRCLDAQWSGALRAGQVVSLAGSQHLIVTAAHLWENNADGGGSNQQTRLWLGQIKT
jgi:hypothetical protein